jgi:rhodanese-related sulfurtransferase
MPHCRILTAASLPPSLLKTMAAALLLGMSMLTAAASEPASVAQATQTVPAAVADEGCSPEPVVAPKTSPSPAPAPVLDHGCWIGYSEAEKLSPLWVDVRSLPETRAAPMPGALQIPLHRVSTKTFLKETPVVLIGNGTDDAEMAMICHQLKEAGFTQLRILRHGARTWYRAGQPLLGNAETIMALDSIDAGYFHRGQVARVWQVIGVNLPEKALQSPAFIGTVLDAKSLDQAVDQIHSLVRERQQTRTKTETAAYAPTAIIIAADETATQQLRQRWRELSGKPGSDVLWLVGGWNDYVTFVEQQRRIAAVAANPPPLQRPCGS